MNNELADRLIGVLMARPDLHDQSSWVSEWHKSSRIVAQLDREPNKCNTTACAAGWIAALTLDDAILGTRIIHKDNSHYIGYVAHAREALDVTTEQSMALFHTITTTEGVVMALKYLKDYPHATADDISDAVAVYEREA